MEKIKEVKEKDYSNGAEYTFYFAEYYINNRFYVIMTQTHVNNSGEFNVMYEVNERRYTAPNCFYYTFEEPKYFASIEEATAFLENLE